MAVVTLAVAFVFAADVAPWIRFAAAAAAALAVAEDHRIPSFHTTKSM